METSTMTFKDLWPPCYTVLESGAQWTRPNLKQLWINRPGKHQITPKAARALEPPLRMVHRSRRTQEHNLHLGGN